MKKRILGKGGLEVSAIGLGCMGRLRKEDGRMKNYEGKFSRFRSLQDGDEDRGEFVAFLPQRRELFRIEDPRVHEELKPVGSFFNFAQAIATFCNELGFAPCAECFPIIGAD